MVFDNHNGHHFALIIQNFHCFKTSEPDQNILTFDVITGSMSTDCRLIEIEKEQFLIHYDT